MEKRGKFVSVWDGGYEIACECVVEDGNVVKLGEYIAGHPDDDVDALDEEYVEIDGKRHTAAPHGDDGAEDEYGNGIIWY